MATAKPPVRQQCQRKGEERRHKVPMFGKTRNEIGDTPKYFLMQFPNSAANEAPVLPDIIIPTVKAPSHEP